MENRDAIGMIQRRYLSCHKEKTLRHAENVAETAVWLAGVYQLDIEKVRLAALLHDISAIMTPQEMYALAVERGLQIDAAEEKYRFLLHQRISRIIAQEDFDIHDPEILDAVECHTTLKKHAGMYDKVLFIADKISWDQQGLPPYYDALRRIAAESLDDACLYFIQYQFDNNLLLMPHQWIIEAYKDLKGILKNQTDKS